MEGEEVCFWLFLFDLEGLTPLPTYPKKGSKPMQFTLKNYFWWVRLILKFFENGFKKGKEASRHKRNKMR